jgi:MFS family permease
VVISLFLLAPLMPATVYLFAAAMGVLWLSTVPLTNGIIAGVFGVKHMSMLAGIVFFSHQVGSFLGVWLGGYLYSTQGNYNMVWGIAIVLGVMSGLINLPINERPLARTQAA